MRNAAVVNVGGWLAHTRAGRLPLLGRGGWRVTIYLVYFDARDIFGYLRDHAHRGPGPAALLRLETVLLHINDGTFHVADTDLDLGSQVDVDKRVEGGLLLPRLVSREVAKAADEDGQEDNEAND